MSRRSSYPSIRATDIRVGDVVRLNGQFGRFEILKAKSIIKGRIQIKCRDRFWPTSTVRKFNLKTNTMAELIERDGKDMATKA